MLLTPEQNKSNQQPGANETLKQYNITKYIKTPLQGRRVSLS